MNGPVLDMGLGLPSKAVMKLCVLKMRQRCANACDTRWYA